MKRCFNSLALKLQGKLTMDRNQKINSKVNTFRANRL